MYYTFGVKKCHKVIMDCRIHHASEKKLQSLSLEMDSCAPASSANSPSVVQVLQSLWHGLVEGFGEGQSQEAGAHCQTAHERHRQAFASVGLRGVGLEGSI